MKTSVKTILASLVLVLGTGCVKHNGSNDVLGAAPTNSAADGTVDGGGGNSVINPNTGETVLLDLAENIDKEPYDFNIRDKILKVDQGTDEAAKLAAINKWSSYSKMVSSGFLRKLLGADDEFFIWAMETSLRTNQEIASGYYSQSVYDVHVSAFELKGKQVVTNVRYALTDNTLDDVGDTGVMKITNPSTKKQLAVQDGNGFVLINKTEYAKLDENSKIALKLHESILYIMLKFNPKLIKEQGTAPIRKFVQDLFNYAFVSDNVKDQLLSPETVRASFQALMFPRIKPKYDMIGKISDASNDASLECKLEQSFYKDPQSGQDVASANYFFSKNGERLTNAYSMDIDFFMKFQMYLVSKGICTFKPQPCKVGIYNVSWLPTPSYRYFVGTMPLPDYSDDVVTLTSQLLPKYQTARFCQ